VKENKMNTLLRASVQTKSVINRKAFVKHPPQRRIETSPANLTVLRNNVAVLVPAHNEEKDIEATIDSLRNLTRQPDQIVVISDNSTDKTVDIARAMGVTVLETSGNTHKKAGALNTGFRHLIKDGEIPEFVVTMDADTVFDPGFLNAGLNVMSVDKKLGVLSAVCEGKKGLAPMPSWPPKPAAHLDDKYQTATRQTIRFILSFIVACFNKAIVWMQEVEYARAGTLRIRSDIHTMSGAGSIIRAEPILQLLASHQQRSIETACLYAERADNLVEDFTLTLDIKKLGWRCTNNYYSIAHTDLMRTLPTLVRQRKRWVRGTIDELRRRKFSREARTSSLVMIFGISILPLFYLWPVLIIHGIAKGTTSIADLWLLALMGVYQAWMSHKMGWKSMIIILTVIPDLIYSVIRHYWVISSVIMSYRSKTQTWE
jgi:cellulose synthase/poly-beta-1,6-N-acetylglucosamine synthase-like glycosyltransferase